MTALFMLKAIVTVTSYLGDFGCHVDLLYICFLPLNVHTLSDAVGRITSDTTAAHVLIP